MLYLTHDKPHHTHTPWNKGKITGQKPPLKLNEVWAIRIRLQIANKTRDLALFNLALDSKLRSCDLVKLKVSDVAHGSHIAKRCTIMQMKIRKPVQFEITKQTRSSLSELIKNQSLSRNDYLFKSRFHQSDHITTRQYARLLKIWIIDIGLDPYEYETHSIRRTKVSMIYQKTKNIRAIQLLLGHSNLDSTVRYLGVELDDALDVAENTEI
ncbi:MAG TPA: integrase [Gammaproteobacteria bacterium]|nr:integrase [Gammaproteobacteria bacterium]